VAFRCKGRHFCPLCPARRLAEWSAWLDEHLLAAVVHRQVVLTLPQAAAICFIRDLRRLGILSRLATCKRPVYAQAVVRDREVTPGLVVCMQTFGSVAQSQPHLHRLTESGRAGWPPIGPPQ
jgi:hypothetical protein